MLPEAHTQARYDTWFAEVVSAFADERVFRNGRWQWEAADPGLRTLHHLGGGVYGVPAHTVRGTALMPCE